MFEQPPQDGVLEQPPTPPPSGPAAPLQDGGILQQPPTQGVLPPVTRGQGVLPEDGEPQTSDEGTIQSQQPAIPNQPPTVEEDEEPVPPCPEGQVLDEETRLCLLEEPEAAGEGPEQSEESDSEDGGNN